MARFSRRYLLQLADRLEPSVRAAFAQAIRNIRSNTRITVLTGLLEQGRIEEALASVGLNAALLTPLANEVSRLFLAGGAATMAAFPPSVRMMFEPGNPRAEAWVFGHSSTLVSAILNDQRQTIRDYLRTGIEQGRNPRQTALDLIGRVNPQTGRREGGIIGLTSNQAAAVINAREQLLNFDREYFKRGLRNRSFDRVVERAFREGRRLTQAQLVGILGSYSDRLLRLRGETIARTETIAALHAGQREALEQGMGRGLFGPQHIVRIWRATGDIRTRDSHMNINGEAVGWNERFSNGLLHPAEPGGPPEEVINCRCWLETQVDFIGIAIEQDRRSQGG